MLLDLVDKYWNGSKSLHQNYKFLGSANQLLKQYYPGNAHGAPADPELAFRLKQLQEENKKLQARHAGHESHAQEVDALKKRLSSALEENKRVQQECASKAERLEREFGLEAIESQNGAMRRENEIMRIKLKQYEQLQSLTAMLQESHKSLVTTNDHLLQEINARKREVRARGYAGGGGGGLSDGEMCSPRGSTHEAASYGSGSGSGSGSGGGGGGSPAKRELRKQYEQLNSSLTNRYGFPKC